jgi:deoxycytidylate deaminase
MNLDWTKLKGCSILVVKQSKTERKLSNAKPCPLCQKLLTHIGIKDIYYTNEYGEIVRTTLSEL